MLKHSLIIACALIMLFSNSYAQESSSDFATVYIVRTSKTGMAVKYKYFLNDQYLGKWNYGKYIKLKVKPGKHIIWAKADNVSFVTANLKANNSYILNAKSKIGAISAAVSLSPVSNVKEKEIDRTNKCLTKKIIPYNPNQPHPEQAKMDKIISKSLSKYEMKRKTGKVQLLLYPVDPNKFSVEKPIIKTIDSTPVLIKKETPEEYAIKLQMEERSKMTVEEILIKLKTDLEKAVAKENYDAAEKLKKGIDKLEANKSKINKLEAVKLNNIIIEDYDKVIALEKEINLLKN